MIRAVFFDIDGTLLPETKPEVPESTMKAIRRLKEKGILIFAATGRHMLEIEDLPLEEIPFDGYVLLNGQLCTDKDGNLISDYEISGPDAETMLQIFREKELPVMIIEKDRMYINMVNGLAEKAQKEIHTPVPEKGRYEGEKIYQFVVYASEEEVSGLRKKVSECRITSWNPNAVDVIAKGGSKVRGIRQMLSHYHLTESEIMAFGDGENDMEMLSCAGTGVAMGDAGEALKENADYVTGPADQDGVWDACCHFGLL